MSIYDVKQTQMPETNPDYYEELRQKAYKMEVLKRVINRHNAEEHGYKTSIFDGKYQTKKEAGETFSKTAPLYNILEFFDYGVGHGSDVVLGNAKNQTVKELFRIGGAHQKAVAIISFADFLADYKIVS